jgi:hypothetical protein
MIKICIVLQGQIYHSILNELIDTYKDVKDKIISTWTTEDIDCINICKQNGFEVIIQDPPEYITQANYQIKSLSAGFRRAKELGYTHIFRCRTDIKINDINKLLNIINTDYSHDRLIFLTMYKNTPFTPEYLTDHVVFGPVEKMINYWAIYQTSHDTRFVELFLMETYFAMSNIQYDDIKDNIYLLCKKCYENNITIEFTKEIHKWHGNIIYRYYINNCHPNSLNERAELNII